MKLYHGTAKLAESGAAMWALYVELIDFRATFSNQIQRTPHQARK
jgi:hypothetical protein